MKTKFEEFAASDLSGESKEVLLLVIEYQNKLMQLDRELIKNLNWIIFVFFLLSIFFSAVLILTPAGG